MKLKAMKASGKLPQETKYNQLCLAFWTCLQLERYLPTPAYLKGATLTN